MRDELAIVAAELSKDTGDTPQESVTDAAPGVTEETETVPETQTITALEAPSNFSAEQRETFSKLPREAQEIILSRHKDMLEDYTRKTTELATQRKSVDEINAILEPYKQEMELQGVKPAEVVQRLLAAQRFLLTDPSNAIRYFAQQFNVDLTSFAKAKTEDEAYMDPAVKALRDEVTQLKARLQQQDQASQNQTVASAQKQINEFRDAKNDDGTSKHPHFEQLKGLMGALVSQGKTMEQAYEEASYTLPEVRERIASEAAKAAQAEALKKAEEARKQKAKEAKTAASTIRSRGTASEESGSKLSLREELAKNLRESGSGRI